MKSSKFTAFTSNRITLAVSNALSAISAFFFYSCRANYVFLDIAVFKGIAWLLLSLMILNALLSLLTFVAYSYDIQFRNKPLKEYGSLKILSVICFVAMLLFLILVTINIAIAGEETVPVIMRMAAKNLTPFILVCAIVFFAAIFPSVKNKKFRIVSLSLTAVGIVCFALYTLAPVCDYKITSDPLVIDCGGDSYSVVFATNDEGTGYIEYEYDGEKIKLFDEVTGRIKGDSKIHTITVPKEHLDGNSYRVGSTRVIEAYSYGSYKGKEVFSREYSFNAPAGENQQWLCVSDWHTRLGKAYDAVSLAGEYDGVIMLGDAAPGLMFEDEIKDYIVEFGGALCKGEMPVVYIRGNHETRGEYAAKLPDYLGMDSFYFNAAFGDYEFVVLDSGEDKPDAHPEYGGMVNYSNYHKEMIDWFENLPATDKKTIVFSHAHIVCVEEDLCDRAYTAMKNIGANYLISGHHHTCEFFELDGISVYLDGGYDEGKFTASIISLSPGGIRFEARNNAGEKVFDRHSDL